MQIVQFNLWDSIGMDKNFLVISYLLINWCTTGDREGKREIAVKMVSLLPFDRPIRMQANGIKSPIHEKLKPSFQLCLKNIINLRTKWKWKWSRCFENSQAIKRIINYLGIQLSTRICLCSIICIRNLQLHLYLLHGCLKS